MILIIHNTKDVKRVLLDEKELTVATSNVSAITFDLAQQYQEESIVWCNEMVYQYVDFNWIEKQNNNRLFLSFNPYGNYLPKEIGFVEDSPFINVNKKVHYPTWQMSSWVGMMKASTIVQTDKTIWQQKKSFDYILNSIAKTYQPLGLFCYSEPKLLKEKIVKPKQEASFSKLFVFVKQHYKAVWIYLLFLDMVIYQRKFPLWAFFKSFFYKKIKSQKTLAFDEVKSVANLEAETIDVIIPTIGRKKYLYDVLCDLRNQKHLPQNVIIVEQNPLPESSSALDFITTENWPFQIKHIFTHQTGACQARNKALALVESKWCFLNDDDNRFEENLLEEALRHLKNFKLDVIQVFYPAKGEKQSSLITNQSAIFGSGNSFIKSALIQKVSFDLKLEFGYGEDTDYGLQIRNCGSDIIYIPFLTIRHLKAPMGGFRTKFNHQWSTEEVPPKPSPTIMYVKQKWQTKEQILGYKTVLFLKYYKVQTIKNPIRYYRMFQKQWSISKKWAKTLRQQV